MPAIRGLIAALVCLLVLAGTALAFNPPKVAKGKNGNPQLMVFNKAAGKYEGFMVKAVAYKPVPLGRAKDNEQDKGAQLCYPINPTPWGDYVNLSPCYDSDYFGFMADAKGKVMHKYFQMIWDRDLKILKEMGVNTIRLYDTNPQFRSHKPFLDACLENQIAVIYPLWLNPDTLSKGWPVTDQDPKQYPGQLPLMDGIKKQYIETRRHPAILFYVAGNEAFNIPFLPDQQYIIDRINMVLNYFKSQPSRPVSTCSVELSDNPDQWRWYLKTFPDIDFVMVNSGYRGDACVDPKGYGRLWNILADVVAPTGKPFLLGEYGVHDNEEPNYSRRHFNCFLKSADQNRARANFMGVAYFEYSDEKDKEGYQKQMGVLKPELATTIADNRIADKLIKKTLSYPGLGKGRWEMFQPYKPGDPPEAKFNYHQIWN